MKTSLTPKQSQRLIELGVDPGKASSSTKVYEQLTEKVRWESKLPIFTIADLLELLPKEITVNGYPYHLNIDYPYLLPEGVAARYLDEEGDSLTGVICPKLIDSLYELLCWTLTRETK